jgi:L-2-hydroxyglutarate oxidase
MEEARIRDVAVVGAGAVGLATAAALARGTTASVVVLEAEDRVAAHQTGHNSGVVHSGLYYRPGSLKARLCAAGREALYRFCAERGLPHERCGKVVVATRPEELPGLDELERRGRANGLAGLARLSPGALREREPHAAGIAALYVPDTGIADFAAVAGAHAEQVREAGGEVRTRARLLAVRRDGEALALETAAGVVRARGLVNCAGLQSDRVARLCGSHPGVAIVPFRGEYHALVAERRHLVRHLIYPVPDPRFPFLGVHLTRTIGGGVEAGPNAVLAFAREGYRKRDVSARDLAELLAWPGFWRMAARHAAKGLGEAWRSHSRAAFVAALRRLVPELRASDVAPAGAGVRAQALAPDGRLVDDFHVVDGERAIHVLNAPSPAATASIAIGEAIAARAGERFGLRRRAPGG